MKRRDFGFPAPKCRVKDCPRHGKNLWVSAEYPRSVKGTAGKEIASLFLFRCVQQNPYRSLHTLYVGPNGEQVTRGARGEYRFNDAFTGQPVEFESDHARTMSSATVRQRLSKAQRRLWGDADYSQRRVAEIREANQSPERREKISAAMKLRAADPSYIEHQRRTSRDTWADPKIAKRRTVGTKKALARPEVKAAQIRGLKAAWSRRKARIAELEALAKRTPRKDGRTATKAALYIEGERLHSELGITWDTVTLQLLPTEYKADPEAAVMNMRAGASYHRRKVRG